MTGFSPAALSGLAPLAAPTARGSRAVVVGAGPAGLAAAERLAGSGLQVVVCDRMPSVARKFLLAGRGGLNLTHSEPIERLLNRYGEARPALEGAIRAYAPETLVAWCEELGQPTFVGTSGRVFPKSLKASPLLRAWLGRLQAAGVTFRTRHRWTGFGDDGALRFETPDGPLSLEAAVAVLALGGASWPRLGSDGAWREPLAGAGVAIAELRPANCGFHAPWSEHFASRFAGEPVKRAALSFGGRTVRGEATVTASGLEGGLIYAVAAEIREAIAREGRAAPLLDLRPDLDLEALTRRLSGDRGSRSLSTHLRKAAGLLPVAVALLREAGPPPDEPAALAARIKAVPLRLTGPFAIDRAISTAGGVRFAELDHGFMLKRRPGVFLAGEMLDWEAPTGGYLLQACFATGAAAADGAARWLARPAADVA